MRRETRRKRWVAGILGLTLALAAIPAVALAVPGTAPTEAREGLVADGAGETNSAPTTPGSEDAGTVGDGQIVASGAVTADTLDTVYVSPTGDDVNGAGTEESPVASLAKAVQVVNAGGTIYLQGDIDAKSLALVDGKSMTIDGNGHTVTRAEGFLSTNDEGRGGYNPAMIEVANGATLTLRNITLDDRFRAKAESFELASGTSGNEAKVHDGIIASYGDGAATIVLGDKTTLKNFGGLSAVYITGEDGAGATLVMESGSKICDDGLGSRKGGYAAIYNHGGTARIEQGASVEKIDGRAIMADNAAVTNINGTITDITASDKVKYPAGAMNGGFGGIVLYAQGNTRTTLGATSEISNIKSNDGNSADVMLWLVGATFTSEQGSIIKDIDTIGLADSNGSTMTLDGRVENCNLDKVLFRVRGSRGAFELGEHGVITGCSTSDYGIVYVQAGESIITIAGEISNCEVDNAAAVYLTNNGIHSCDCTITSTGKIKNISGNSGYGVWVDGPKTKLSVEGEISGCRYKAINYRKVFAGSIVELNGGTIEGNNSGGAQISVASTDARADDAGQHVRIAPGVLKGNTTVDLVPFDVTLDAEYETIRLGQASNSAATSLKNAVEAAHDDWKVVGTSAVWLQPSSDEIHLTVPRIYSMKKTSLYAALIPLDKSGESAPSGELILQEVGNADPVDVTLTGLDAGRSYAMMFVNSNEYVLAPDDTTVYIGGGQGDELYDNGGFPAPTFTGCLDDINKLEIGGVEVSSEDLMGELLKLLTVSYTDLDGNPVKDDSEPGEYVIKLGWAGETPHDIKINGSDVSPELRSGRLIVRYVENADEAIDGTNTHELVTEEPAEQVKSATAIAKKGFLGLVAPKFYTNDGEDREVDVEGIQILDDDLLIDEDGTDRQELLEEKAVDSGILPELGEGEAYRYDFHYLDLVDAHNGNAWVSASYGTTVYLPYPDGMTYEEAEDIEFTVVHYPGLHREYGFSGRDEVETAIASCTPQVMESEKTPAGIKFDVPREGFSPFAIVWKADAHTITAIAGEGGTIDPEGAVAVAEGEDRAFTMTPDSGYEIASIEVDGQPKNLNEYLAADGTAAYTFEKVQADHSIEVTFRSIGGGTDNPPCIPPASSDPDPSDPSKPDTDVDKELDGRDLVAGEFSFTIAATGANASSVSPRSLTGRNDAAGNVTFAGEGFTFEEAGTYAFTVSENLPSDDDPGAEGVQSGGVTYDESSFTLTAEVTEGAGGKLAVSWRAPGRAIAFRNSYEPSGSVDVTLGATKVLEGRDLAAGEFAFELRNRDGELVATAANAADGSVTFGAIHLTEPGTYTYTIAEAAGDLEGVTYDGATHTAVITVTDNGDGTLSATVSYGGGDALPVFTNTYVEPTEPTEPTEPEEPTGPGEPDESIPQTGDGAPFAIAVIGAAGVAAIGAGIALNRRSRR